MGICSSLASRQAKCEAEYGSSIATLSPAHSLRRRSSCSSEQGTGHTSAKQLQDISISAVASALARGRIGTKELSVLPLDLLQLVIDKLVQTGDLVGILPSRSSRSLQFCNDYCATGHTRC